MFIFFNIYLIEIMSNKLEVIIKYYNDISNLGVRLWKLQHLLVLI